MGYVYVDLLKEAVDDCKAGRFFAAEQKLTPVLDFEKKLGLPPSVSNTVYWWLMARHRGDDARAMAEWCKM
jgi:hypothetical protein